MNTNAAQENENVPKEVLDLPDFFEEVTLRRQMAYNQAIARIRADLLRRAKPLPVLFDEEGRWVF